MKNLKKKTIVMIIIILIIFIVKLYMCVFYKMDKDIYICIEFRGGRRSEYGTALPETLAPSYYVITKSGEIFRVNQKREKGTFEGKVNSIDLIILNHNKNDEKLICKILDYDSENVKVYILDN